MDLKGKKIAVLVADQYQELEVWYPCCASARRVRKP